MIAQETAARIWQCHREIESSEKLLNDMEEKRKQHPDDPHAQKIRDCFGRGQNLQLGIPMGDNSHRLFDVSPKLAESIIKAHIANKKAELVEINEQAKIELDSQRSVAAPLDW